MKDERRDEAMRKRGLTILRISDDELEERFEESKERVRLAVKELLNQEFAKKGPK